MTLGWDVRSSLRVCWECGWCSNHFQLCICCLELQQPQHSLPTLPSILFIPEKSRGYLIKNAEAMQDLPSCSIVHWTSAVNPALPWHCQRASLWWLLARSPSWVLSTRLVAFLGSTPCPEMCPSMFPSPWPRGPATKPCSIIPRAAPGPWLPRKLMANTGAGGWKGQ